MTKHIEADTLREWLDDQQPVTVLDIRTDEDRAQWAIPGSAHVNASPRAVRVHHTATGPPSPHSGVAGAYRRPDRVRWTGRRRAVG